MSDADHSKRSWLPIIVPVIVALISCFGVIFTSLMDHSKDELKKYEREYEMSQSNLKDAEEKLKLYESELKSLKSETEELKLKVEAYEFQREWLVKIQSNNPKIREKAIEEFKNQFKDNLSEKKEELMIGLTIEEREMIKNIFDGNYWAVGILSTYRREDAIRMQDLAKSKKFNSAIYQQGKLYITVIQAYKSRIYAQGLCSYINGEFQIQDAYPISTRDMKLSS